MKFLWIAVGGGTLIVSGLLALWFLPERGRADVEFANDYSWIREPGIDAIVLSGEDLPDVEMLFEESKKAREIPQEEAEEMKMPEMTLESEEEENLEFAREQWRSFRSLPKEEQRRIQRVYSQFEKLNESQKQEVREWSRQWLSFPEEEKTLLRHRLQKWHRLTPDEKDTARERWAAPPSL